MCFSRVWDRARGSRRRAASGRQEPAGQTKSAPGAHQREGGRYQENEILTGARQPAAGIRRHSPLAAGRRRLGHATRSGPAADRWPERIAGLSERRRRGGEDEQRTEKHCGNGSSHEDHGTPPSTAAARGSKRGVGLRSYPSDLLPKQLLHFTRLRSRKTDPDARPGGRTDRERTAQQKREETTSDGLFSSPSPRGEGAFSKSCTPR